MSSFAELFPPSSYGKHPVAIFDGGMGTTLQAPPFDSDIETALWSGELLRSEAGRAKLTKLHNLWIESGSDVLGSATYQSTLPLFLPEGKETYTLSDIDSSLTAMNNALSLITASSLSSTSRSLRPLSALSLGPFGAQCSPGQEYAGLYPKPFGQHSTPSSISYSPIAGSILPLSEALERVGTTKDHEEDHLAAWHLTRLENFAKSSSFSDISLLAFETTPVIHEARAIRRAMSIFNSSLPSTSRKPFYISFVFILVEGKPIFPDLLHQSRGLAAQAQLIVEATFGSFEGEKVELETPNGIGINCTNPVQINTVVHHLGAAMAAVTSKAPATERPWLVVYPDGGSVYDVVTRTWSNPDGISNSTWALLLTQNIKKALALTDGAAKPTFGGVLAGGCCKAGPEAIQELRKELVKEKLVKV